MSLERLESTESKPLEQILGYLNFSAGAEDPQFLANLNELYGRSLAEIEAEDQSGKSKGAGTKGTRSKSASSRKSASSTGGLPIVWKNVRELLENKLHELSLASPAFSDTQQSSAVISLVFDHLFDFYLEFHRDLLFHQTADRLFQPFLVGRIFERVLQQGGPWDERDRIVESARAQLDDYIGYRPVAALESQKIEPYAHEWIRPIPLYVRAAGVANGAHHQVMNMALEILRAAHPHVLEAAHFDPECLDELAIDPRSYDFEHPVSRRPNYQFGQWDPVHIDNNGRYRRYIVQQVTMEALMSRCLTNDAPQEELLYEAAAVLAGTVLMGSGMSGWGPGCFDSGVSLETLMPVIAGYRDAFYEHLLHSISGTHGDRLRDEAIQRRQPFGAARQHLNARLANLRASQLQRVNLAAVFARMGFPDAARRQTNVIQVASARMISRIDCRLTSGRKAVTAGDFDTSLKLLEEIFDLLKRAIECGALIDPWNILGFDANFSLFPAMENTVRDHRADELIDLVEDIFAYCALVWSEAAAADDKPACERMESRMREIVDWWHQFAVHEVSSVDASNSREVFNAAENVVQALKLWHEGGAEAGNVRFWAAHSDLFQSPRAYSLVIETLLERGDFVASMALLIHWLSQIETVALEEVGNSFPYLASRWMHCVVHDSIRQQDDNRIDADTWQRLVKFLDYVEANADSHWSVPDFELGSGNHNGNGGNGDSHGDPHDKHQDHEYQQDELEEDNPFSAAYDDVVYRDSTDDGMEGPIFDSDSLSDSEIDEEIRRLDPRLMFLNMSSQLWQIAATVSTPLNVSNLSDDAAKSARKEQCVTLGRWRSTAIQRQQQWIDLLAKVENHRLPRPSNDSESMANYDRHRWFKEHLADRIIECYVRNSQAIRTLSAAELAIGCEKLTSDESEDDSRSNLAGDDQLQEDQTVLIRMLSTVLAGNSQEIPSDWNGYLTLLKKHSISYIPLSRGGDSLSIARARTRQDEISHLLEILPRLGLLFESTELIDTVREMERTNPAGNGALTEFDELYQNGFESLVESLIRFTESNYEQTKAAKETGSTETGSTETNSAKTDDQSEALGSEQDADVPQEEVSESETIELPQQIFNRLEQLTEPLLATWLEHSTTLRLSVLEKVVDDQPWEEVVEFIRTFGGDLFTQNFFGLSNIRAILHQGVNEWFDLIEESADEPPFKLMRALTDSNRRQMAAKLTLVLEAIIENFGEYRDYNSTTTQSDQGDLLYMLLDFLRLRMRYDRIAWHLNPVKWAHRVLVENHRDDAAKLWRQSLSERVSGEARRYLRELKKLQTKYAMQMPTVSDKLKEKFVKPLQIDRLRALIPLAVQDARNESGDETFKLLEKEVNVMARTPTGVGLEVPQWILALQDEVDHSLSTAHDELGEIDMWIKTPVMLAEEEIEESLARIARQFNHSEDEDESDE